MVGRVNCHLVSLLTILISFFTFYPGRDAQVNYVVGDASHFWSYFNFFFGCVFVRLSSLMVLRSTLMVLGFVTLIFYAFVDTSVSYCSSSSPFTRKHGRWRNRSLFPSVFVVLSSVALAPCQAYEFALHKFHRLPAVASVPRRYHLRSLKCRMCNEWVPFFNDSYAISDDPEHFYAPDLCDLVFSSSEFERPSPVLPSKFLHLEGSLMSRHWEEDMAKAPKTWLNLPNFMPDLVSRDDDDSSIADSSVSSSSTMVADPFDSGFLSFKSTPSYVLKTPMHQLSDELVTLLLDLPLEPAVLHTSVATRHMVDDSHLLRTARPNSELDISSPNVFGVLIDSGCSVSCSGFKEDFHGQLAIGDFGFVNTADGQAKIEGFGMLRWDVISEDGERCTIAVPGYYSPTVEMRLLSPQDYCRYHHFDPSVEHYRGSSDWMSLDIKTSADGEPLATAVIHAHIDPSARLPFIHAELGHHDVVNGKESRCHCNVAMNPVSTIYDVRNFNLSDAQKKLKLDHDRLGHLSFKMIQRLYQPEDLSSPDFDGHTTFSGPCLLAKDVSQLRCQPPLCEACEIARARRRPTGAATKIPNPDVIDGIRAEDLKPGDCVSVDQCESSVRGRRLESKGREKWDYKYCGGTLFYDHASGKIFVHHQTSLSSHETNLAKEAFERDAALCGFSIKKYRTDNGVFTSKSFKDSLSEHQYTDRSAVGAHHQNGVAEANIGRVQRMARSMMLHLRLHWPDEFSADLWPFALDYAVYIYNHIPTKGKPGMPSPAEVFCGTKIGCVPLRRLRVFGCPSCVLDPRLQDGKKIPKWEPRSRKGQFLGFSKEHASTVGLLRNIRTGHISPQFHVVCDETFSTVASDNSIDLAEQWIDLFLNARDLCLEGHDESIDGPLPELDPDYIPPEPDPPASSDQGGLLEDALRQGGQVPIEPTVPTSDSSSQTPARPREPVHQQPIGQPEFPDQPAYQPREPLVPPIQQPNPSSDSGVGWSDVEVPPPRGSSIPEPAEPVQPFSPLRPRRSRRPRSEWSEPPLTYESRGKQVRFVLRSVDSRTFSHVRCDVGTDAFAFAVVDWEDVTDDPLYQYFHHLFQCQVDPKTLELLNADDAFHPFAFAAKVQSEDFPSYHDILRMTGEERRKWIESMDVEMSDLTERNAYELVSREEVLKQGHNIVKSMWAFRRKRRPDGSVSRYKSRLVVRGDQQKKFYDFTMNDTFAPVVEWSTVRMLFSLGVINEWKTASIDFKSAFTQAILPEPIYLELPPGYQKANPHLADKVMKITTSLYGDQRAANLWYNKIRKSLETDLGFKCSDYDPCLFIRDDCILCLYVDDAILHARDEQVLTDVLAAIKDAGYAFSRDESFASYLGVLVEHMPDGSKKLSQPGLTKQLLEVMGLTDCNPAKTPISTPLFAHHDSPLHNGSFNYRSALGMLMYLTNNTRPECAYAVNVCAQYSVEPRQAHAEAVRRVCRYLKGTLLEGLYVKPATSKLSLDCFVDADYAGQWNLPEATDPATVKSRAGFVITLGNVPVLWKSKRIHDICLSTMESEYISLSMAMRSLVYLRGLLFEIDAIFDLKLGDKLSSISTVFEDNTPALTLATTDPPRMTPRSKSLAVKYHWFRSHLSSTTIIVKHVGSKDNTADIFTKPLPFDAFTRHRKSLCGW